MTDPLEPAAVRTSGDLLPGVPPPPPPWIPAMPGRVLVAALTACAGLIHLVMTPAHMAESTTDGWGFLLAGWAQLGLALLLLVRPGKPAAFGVVAVNAFLIGLWAWSRTAGLPIGGHAGVPEDASLVDLTTVALEATAIVAVLVLLGRPALGAGWSASTIVMASAVPVAAVVLTSAAIASPAAIDHHGGVGDDHHADDAPMGSGGDGHDHEHGAEAGAAMATPVDDKGLSLLTNGHQHEAGAEVALDAETQAALDAQLAITRELAERFPTIAAAEAAGYRRAGPFAPGLGTHYLYGVDYLNAPGVIEADVRMIPLLIFDGTGPDAPIAGFMYMALGGGAPEGFAGPNDHWHFHSNVCIVAGPNGIDAPLGADRSATQEQCDAFGGRLVANTGYMVHVWSVPGYESPDGMFTEINPRLACPDGTYYMIDLEQTGTRDTVCRV